MLNPKQVIRLLIVVCAFSSMMAFADDTSIDQEATVHTETTNY